VIIILNSLNELVLVFIYDSQLFQNNQKEIKKCYSKKRQIHASKHYKKAKKIYYHARLLPATYLSFSDFDGFGASQGVKFL